jgi:hypothetical protein
MKAAEEFVIDPRVVGRVGVGVGGSRDAARVGEGVSEFVCGSRLTERDERPLGRGSHSPTHTQAAHAARGSLTHTRPAFRSLSIP